MRDGVCVAAPCKVNLHLRVFERRPDGFHDIESVFLALDFGDELHLRSLKERSSCAVLMDGSVPPERNIVYKAVSAFRSRSGWDGGIEVSVRKRIPLGAGLGGGSSDAASTLMGLNAIAGHPLSDEDLSSLGASIGSDVPFFLGGPCALVRGRGEVVEPLPPPRGSWSLVLINPLVPSDTATAYRTLDSYRLGVSRGFDCPSLTAEAVGAALSADPTDWAFSNDFLEPLSARESVYGRMLTDLRRVGAMFASLSGSGSTCFGVFTDSEAASRAVVALSEDWSFVRSARPLARSVRLA